MMLRLLAVAVGALLTTGALAQATPKARTTTTRTATSQTRAVPTRQKGSGVKAYAAPGQPIKVKRGSIPGYGPNNKPLVPSTKQAAAAPASKSAAAPAGKIGDGDGAYAAPGQPIDIRTGKVEPYNSTNAPATQRRTTTTTRQSGTK